MLTSSSSYPFFSLGVFSISVTHCIFGGEALWVYFYFQGKAYYEQKKQSRRQNMLFKWALQASYTYIPLSHGSQSSRCLRKPRLQKEMSILGALGEDKSLSHCPASMSQVRITTWREGITKSPRRFQSRDRQRQSQEPGCEI